MKRICVSHTCRALPLFLLFFFGGVALAQDNVDPKKGRVSTNPSSGYSLEQEVQLGREAAAEIERKLRLLPAEHPASKYIRDLGQRLAEKAPGYKFPYTFKVVREKSINAFALPGGPIYVHTGLMEAANEAELAGVMGHEIAHVVMRHSTRQASRQMKTQLPLAILSGVLGVAVGGWAGALGQMGISLTANGVIMKYSREAEIEADMVGAQIMYDAGYNPEGMVTFFTKLKKQGGGGGPQFLSSHPDPGDRAKNVSTILRRFPAKSFQQNDSAEFLSAKKALSDLTATADSGVAASSTPMEMQRLPAQDIASPNLRAFEHAAYRIHYPENWQVNGSANASVEITPQGGSANGTLSYGVMISGFQPKAKGSTLDAAVRELTSEIGLANPGLHLANSPQAFTVHGRAARRLDWTGASAVREKGKALEERVRIVAFPGKSGVILYVLFVAPELDFNPMWSSAFEPMLRSIEVR